MRFCPWSSVRRRRFRSRWMPTADVAPCFDRVVRVPARCPSGLGRNVSFLRHVASPGRSFDIAPRFPRGVWSVLLAGAWCRVASCVLQRRCLPIRCRAGVRPSRGLCAMRFRFQVARRRRSAGGGSMRSGGRVPSSFGPAGLDAGRRRRRRSFRCGCMATASAGDLPFRGWSASPSVPLGRRRLYRRTALSACLHDLGLCPPCADPFPLQPRLYSVSALALAPFRLASGPFL